MELSRKEEYRNQKVSIAVTVLSFVVMLLFFIFTNVITASSHALPLASNEMLLDLTGGNLNTSDIPAEVTSVSAAREPRSSNAIKTSNGNIPLKSSVYEIAEKYKNTANQQEALQNTETPLTRDAAGLEEGDIKSNSAGNSSFGYHLSERTILLKPQFANRTNEQGTVVVEITVDKNGSVTEAIPDGRGTTTSSVQLKNEAKKMAQATTFSESKSGEEQRGTIIITFSFK